MYLIDTNVLSELTKRQADTQVVNFFAGCEKIVISAITLHEISFGIDRSAPGKRAKLQLWFDKFMQNGPEIIDVNQHIALVSGAIRAFSESKGRPMAIADSILAASAQSRKLILATRNTKDFEFCNIALLNPFTGGQ